MLLFAHLGITLALGRYVAARYTSGTDLFFLVIGSILPDIIDKPLGEILYGTPSMGRIFTHTLLFLLILTALAAYTWDARIASLAGGVLAHLALDFMWNSPVILFWPLFGPFPVAKPMDVLSYMQMLLMGLRNPVVMVPECLGLAEIIYLAVTMRQSAFKRFKGAARSLSLVLR